MVIDDKKFAKGAKHILKGTNKFSNIMKKRLEKRRKTIGLKVD